MTAIQKSLFALRDEDYRLFQCRLMPTVDPETVIGVRTPALRAFAKTLGADEQLAFLSELPHTYYEENNLHGFLLERIRDYGEAVAALERFLPFIDNWATCDQFCPRVFARHRTELLGRIRVYLSSGRTYTVRYGLGLLMRYYLDDAFSPEILALAASVRSEEYYVNMMLAWLFATALARQYESALPYLTWHRLSVWTHNKTIQKAVESFRVPEDHKEFLKTLRRK